MRTRLQFGYALDRPCDIYDLISKNALSLRFANTSSLDGIYLNDGVYGEISVSSLRPSGHQHFTAAHELGHHVFQHGATLDKKIEDMTSNTGQEEVADTFARHLLMPKRAVLTGFLNLNTKPETATPFQFFQVASWLGVGYSTLIQHTRWTLSLISNAHRHELTLKRPQQLKRAACPSISWTGRKELWPISPWWSGSHAHVQVGDIVTGLLNPPPALFEMSDELAIARAVGEAEVSVGGDAKVKVSVARADYVGLYKFRYLEEPLDA
jgi:IrrE N-terminal-like domain